MRGVDERARQCGVGSFVVHDRCIASLVSSTRRAVALFTLATRAHSSVVAFAFASVRLRQRAEIFHVAGEGVGEGHDAPRVRRRSERARPDEMVVHVVVRASDGRLDAGPHVHVVGVVDDARRHLGLETRGGASECALLLLRSGRRSCGCA